MAEPQYIPQTSYFSKIRNDIKIYSNGPCILDKLEQDGNLFLISNMFHQVFHKEVVYAVYG